MKDESTVKSSDSLKISETAGKTPLSDLGKFL